jgi:hypothetical protein
MKSLSIYFLIISSLIIQSCKSEKLDTFKKEAEVLQESEIQEQIEQNSNPYFHPDSIASRVKAYNEIKTYWEEKLHPEKEWSFNGLWHEDAPIYIRSSPEKLLFRKGNQITKELDIRYILPFDTEHFKKLSDNIDPKDSLSLRELKSLIGDLKVSNPKNENLDSLISNSRSFHSTFGTHSRGNNTMLSYSISETPYGACSVDDSSSYNRIFSGSIKFL